MDITIKRFIYDKCNGLNSNNFDINQNDLVLFKEMCVNSITYLLNRGRLNKPSMTDNIPFIEQINDSIIDYGYYIFQSFISINKYLQNMNNKSRILQFDISIISKNSSNNINIKQQLKNTILNYVKYSVIDVQNCNDLIYHGIKILLLKTTNIKRCCVIIDRRRTNNKKSDSIFICERNSDNLNNLNIFQIIKESLFNNYYEDFISKMNINNFCLSFHCIDKLNIDIYLFLNQFVTRFYIKDIKFYLKTFFTLHQQQLLDSIFDKTIISNKKFINFKKQYYISKQLFNNKKFINFYKLILRRTLTN